MALEISNGPPLDELLEEAKKGVVTLKDLTAMYVVASNTKALALLVSSLGYMAWGAWNSAAVLTANAITDKDDDDPSTTALFGYAACVSVVVYTLLFFLLLWQATNEVGDDGKELPLQDQLVNSVKSKNFNTFVDVVSLLAVAAWLTALQSAEPLDDATLWAWILALVLTLFSALIGYVVLQFSQAFKESPVKAKVLKKLSVTATGNSAWTVGASIGNAVLLSLAGGDGGSDISVVSVGFAWFYFGLAFTLSMLYMYFRREKAKQLAIQVNNDALELINQLEQYTFGVELDGLLREANEYAETLDLLLKKAVVFVTAIAFDLAARISFRFPQSWDNLDRDGYNSDVLVYAIVVTLVLAAVSIQLEAFIRGRAPNLDKAELLFWEDATTLLNGGMAYVVGETWTVLITATIAERPDSVLTSWIYAAVVTTVAAVAAVAFSAYSAGRATKAVAVDFEKLKKNKEKA